MIHQTTFDGRDCNYYQASGDGIGVFYVPGYTSTLDSDKTQKIIPFCKKNDIPLTIPEWYGYGATGHQTTHAGETNTWLEQAAHILQQHTTGSQIVIGSSMGGWLMLSLALAFPTRAHALVGFAAGYGYHNLCLRHIECYGDKKIQLANNANSAIEFDYNEHASFIVSPLSITCPVSFLHALDDDRVSYQSSISIMEKLEGGVDVSLTLTKTGGHKLQDESSMKWLFDRIQHYRNQTTHTRSS